MQTRQELIAELQRALRTKSKDYEYDKDSYSWVRATPIKKKTIRAVIRELEQ